MDNINVIYSHSVHGDDLMDAFKKLDPKDTGFIRWVKINHCGPVATLNSFLKSNILEGSGQMVMSFHPVF